MFEKYALKYYASDDLLDFPFDEINKYVSRAEIRLGKLTPDRRLHDDYIIDFHVYVENESLSCKIELISHIDEGKTFAIIFQNVSNLSIKGELVDYAASYPSPKSTFTFAQVLDIWYDYQTSFECCILLDNERYILIKCTNIRFED